MDPDIQPEYPGVQNNDSGNVQCPAGEIGCDNLDEKMGHPLRQSPGEEARNGKTLVLPIQAPTT